MPRSYLPESIESLLDEHVDGVLTPEGLAAIEGWVSESEEHARLVAEWFRAQAELVDAERLADVREIFSEPAQQGRFEAREGRSVAEHASTTSERPPSAQPLLGLPVSRSPIVWSTGLACLALLVAIGVGAFSVWPAPGSQTADGDAGVQDTSAPGKRAFRRPTPVAVAYVGRVEDADWRGIPREEGEGLAAGSIVALREGALEIIFGYGARVRAQGPCELQIDGIEAFSLVAGDASVEASFGFKVTTPSSVAVDLGTAFGVSVNEDGGSELHVFEGEVAIRAKRGGAEVGKQIVLKRNQACRCTLGGVSLEEFQANEEKFAWRQRRLIDESELPDLPIRDGLVLWLAADRYVETDETGRVSCWRDLVSAPNTIPDDALQPSLGQRPRLISEGINGMPSIRFGEDDAFLVTPPFLTTDEQTAFVVCSALGKEGDSLMQQILNYNGPPQRDVRDVGGRMSSGVFQIFLRDGDGDGRYAPIGHVFHGLRPYDASRQLKRAIMQEVSADNSIGVGEPTAICFRFSASEGQMAVYVNGRMAQSGSATGSISIVSRKILGRHPLFQRNTRAFAGDIGEVLIYNESLDQQGVAEVSAYLRERFGLGG